MKVAREINVHIGQVKTGKSGDTLKTILGSCVGIGFIWKRKKRCGLAHCLLPKAPQQTFEIDARFVTQAIPSLMALMKIRSENYSEIEAIVAGGGNMTMPNVKSPEGLVGTANVAAAIEILEKLKITIVFKDTNGDHGRKVLINCSDFSFQVLSIPRLKVAG